jgi:RNA polymerase sigma-70 factor (ECF subfamily)
MPSDQEEEAVWNTPGGDSPEEAMMHNELCRVLESSVDRLPQDYRTVFMLRAIEGLSVADTAACLGISPALVKVRLFRARHLLRTMLERELTPSLSESFAFAGARCDRIVASVLARLGLDQASPEDA